MAVADLLPARPEPYEDAVFYDLSAAIVITVPGGILDAQVRVTDDGFLTWECDYGAEAAAITGDPAHAARITGWQALAADIVARVTAALEEPDPQNPCAGRLPPGGAPASARPLPSQWVVSIPPASAER